MRPVDGDETINELLGVIFEKNLKYSIINFNKIEIFYQSYGIQLCLTKHYHKRLFSGIPIEISKNGQLFWSWAHLSKHHGLADRKKT